MSAPTRLRRGADRRAGRDVLLVGNRRRHACAGLDDDRMLAARRELLDGLGRGGDARLAWTRFAWNSDQHDGSPLPGARPARVIAATNAPLGVRRCQIASAIAVPTSSVEALPPISRVRGARGVGEHALDRRDDRRAPPRLVPEELEHHRARPDLADRIGDALSRDVRRRAVHRLEQRRERPLGIDVRRRRDADRAANRGTEVGQDVAEQIRADDDVEDLRALHEVRGEDVDVVRVGASRPGTARAIALEALVPVRHRDRDAVRSSSPT